MPQEPPREWQLVGSLPENYERHFVPAIFGPWATNLLDLSPPHQGQGVLDVGCGTGIVARLAAERVGASGKVVGLDVNPAMLAVAGSLPTEGASVEWQQANAEDIPLPDEAFDLVLCQQSFQFFGNKPAALREMRRVLVSGGRLALSVWRGLPHMPGYAALADALERQLGRETTVFIHAGSSLDSAEELQSLMEGAGFQEVAVRPTSGILRFSSPEDFVWKFVQGTPLALMPSMTQADESLRAAVISEVATRLQPYMDDDGLAFPNEAHVATARK